MKVLIFNGSPRDGNTKFAMKTVKKGVDENISGAETEIIDVADKKINYCDGCDYCETHDGICVHRDDMAEILEKVRDADVMIFGTPVYWWGVTAQIKAAIDRCYALISKPGKKEKKIGIIAIGQDTLDGPQYELISRQFQCIGEYMEWDLVIDKSICANELEDVKNSKEETDSLADLWRKI